MLNKRTYNEEAFDKIFRKKEIIDYSYVSGKMGRRDAQIIKTLKNFGVTGKKCLDIGPGTGRWLQFLKDNGASYLGCIDLSLESLNRCVVLCDKQQKADVENEQFDFDSDFFDITISFMLLEHLRNPDNYISEMIRVTKNNGLILMSIPNILSFISRFRVLAGKLPTAVKSDKTHVKFYTKKELNRLFAPYNLKVEMIPTSISINPYNPKSVRLASNRFLSSFDDHLLFKIVVIK